MVPRLLKLLLLWHFLNNFCVQDSCALSPRVIGGEYADSHEYPAQASLQVKFYGRSFHFCGGTLIEKDIVITAAHCITQNDADGTTPRSFQKEGSIKVVLGKHDLLDTTPTNDVQIRNVKSYRIPEDFGFMHVTYDVALLYLDHPVTLTETVQTVGLSDKKESDLRNEDLIVIGWGRTHKTNRTLGSTRKLKEVETMRQIHLSDQQLVELVKLIPTDFCPEVLRNKTMIDNGRNAFIFTKARDGNSQIYRGGPLYIRNRTTNSLELLGIVSFSTPTSAISVFTNVSTVRNWIEHNIKYLRNNADKECLTTERKKCIFPYVYKGMKYHECIKRDDNKTSCPTRVLNRKHLNAAEESWEECNETCTHTKLGQGEQVDKTSNHACYTKEELPCRFPYQLPKSRNKIDSCILHDGKNVCPTKILGSRRFKFAGKVFRINVAYPKGSPQAWKECDFENCPLLSCKHNSTMSTKKKGSTKNVVIFE